MEKWQVALLIGLLILLRIVVGVLVCCLAPKCCKCCNYGRWFRWLFGWARRKRRLALEWTPELEEREIDNDGGSKHEEEMKVDVDLEIEAC